MIPASLAFGRSERSEFFRALLAVPITMSGFALPIDFVYQLDGYLKYLRPIELPAIYAWGWLMYGLIGLAIALVTIVPAMGVARLLQRSPAVWASRFGAWLSLTILAMVLLRAAKLWLEANEFAVAGWMARHKWEMALVTIVGCTMWIWRRSRMPEGLTSLANFVALAGFGVTLLAFAASSVATVWQTRAPAPSAAAQSGKHLPNVVLLTMDTLSADHMSLYGYERSTTSNLDALAKGASVFERYYANSNFTTPTVYSFMNGVRPWTHRAVQMDAQVEMHIVAQGMVARLKSAGYYTIAVATNRQAAPNYTLSYPWFDEVVDERTNSWLPKFISRRVYAMVALKMDIVQVNLGLLSGAMAAIGAYSEVDHYDPELAMSAARDLVQRRDATAPLFLWVHLLPPHSPYATPGPFVGRFDPGPDARTRFNSSPPDHFLASADKTFPNRLIGRYDESIAYVDHHVGKFIEWLKGQGLFEDSFLVISADHGDSFVKGYGAHTGPLLHDALIHIPLIIKEPGQRAGKRLKVLSEQIDLMPTVLDLAGVPIAVQVEGRSLKPAIQGKEMSGAVFSMNFEQSNRFGALDTGTVAMLDTRWKYTHYMGRMKYPMMPKLEDSLYDLQADPGENTNLVSVQPVIAAKMLAEVQAQLRRHGGRVE